MKFLQLWRILCGHESEKAGSVGIRKEVEVGLYSIDSALELVEMLLVAVDFGFELPKLLPEFSNVRSLVIFKDYQP